MRKIILFSALVMSAVSFAQIAGTSFEEPETFSGKYTDTGDPNVAHPLLNNANEPLVNHTKIGQELGFSAYYVPYDIPDVGLTDGDFVGVTKTKPSTAVPYTHGSKGYRMNDLDGNMIVEFDEVNLTGATNPIVSLDFLLSINSDPTKGNYEGDGTLNQSGHDRLRIYIKDITNSTEIDLFNSTGYDLDEFVPIDPATGHYLLQWQTISESLEPNTTVQLVIEGRNNASSESFWFDNIVFDGIMGVDLLSKDPFRVYPNPVNNGFINISSKLDGPKNISVFDVLGKLVINTSLTGEKLDVSGLSSGIYILKIDQDKTSSTKKLVVN